MPRNFLCVAIVLTLTGLIAAGCATSESGTRALSLLPVSPPSAADDGDELSLRDALNGGIIATVADGRLSDRDRDQALRAEYLALETAPVGQSISWSNERSGLSGEVSAAQAYQVGAQNCRQYTHTLHGVGGPLVARGTACRSEDGAWAPLS